jgi:outer membrane protein TolC
MNQSISKADRFAKALFALMLSTVVALPLHAQNTQVQLKDYAKPASHFPFLISPYMHREVPEPSLSNSPRIDNLLREGKLMLSLNDAITLALENNLDLAIARYNLSIADTDLLRTQAGGTVRGVATGLVQGTPGGGIGGFGTGASGGGAGGTSSGAGGAGSGAAGIVQSTLGAGTAIESFDPILSSGLRIEHASYPQSNTVLTGVGNLQQNTGLADFTYFQAFPTGTSLSVDFNNNRQTSNSRFNLLVPVINSAFRATLRQHLLAGFGTGPNRRFIRIARNNREISDIAFRNQVIATVTQIQNIYWDLVNAYEDFRVKQRALELAGKTLSDNRKQVELGALPPIEVTKAESEVASRNQELITAQTNLELQQLLVKNAVTRNLGDAVLAAAEVVPMDTMNIPDQEPVSPIQDLINDAFAHRPELSEARIDMTNRAISRKAATNALRPAVDLVAFYGGAGLAGEQNPNLQDPPSAPIFRSGFSNAFARLFDNSAPDYAIGFNLQIPLRNREAQADQIRSELEFRQAQLRLQQLQNQIGIEVRNAQFALQQNRAKVEAARKGRDLARNTFDIEQKKYVLGASTNYAVLQAQRDYAQAESNLVAAMTAYEKSRVELDRVTGLTLTHNGIEISEAERGQVQHMPNMQGAVPRENQSEKK